MPDTPEQQIFSYDYDAENRLIAATPVDTAGGLKKVTFQYDYLSRRIRKTTSTYTAGNWTLDTDTTFVYDGWNVIQETITPAGGSASTVQYVWGLDLLGTLQGAGGIGGLLLRNSDAGTFAYLYDANGNVGQLVNVADGSLAARYEYDPFGGLLVADGPEAENNPYRYSTQYFDVETELVAYIFRYYSAKLGRWTTKDPIEEKGGFNLYGFVENNPVNQVDPWGLNPLDAFFRSPIDNLYWQMRRRFPSKGTSFSNDVADGVEIFNQNYQKMKKGNVVGSDQYYHCMANCEATYCSGGTTTGGLFAALAMSLGRELVDYPKNVCKKRIPPHYAVVDAWKDFYVDAKGIAAPKNISCDQTCRPLLPVTSEPLVPVSSTCVP